MLSSYNETGGWNAQKINLHQEREENIQKYFPGKDVPLGSKHVDSLEDNEPRLAITN